METIFSKRLLSLLEEKNMNQRELASKVGVQEATISRYINEQRTPHTVIASKIAEVLETTTDYLLGRSDNPQNPQTWINQISDAPKIDTSDITDEEVEFISFMRRGMSKLTPEQRKKKIELAKLALKMAEEMQKNNQE